MRKQRRGTNIGKSDMHLTPISVGDIICHARKDALLYKVDYYGRIAGNKDFDGKDYVVLCKAPNPFDTECKPTTVGVEYCKKHGMAFATTSAGDIVVQGAELVQNQQPETVEPSLADYKTEELIEELKHRGFDVKLAYTLSKRL